MLLLPSYMTLLGPCRAGSQCAVIHGIQGRSPREQTKTLPCVCLSVTEADRWHRTSRSLLEVSNFFKAQARTHLETLSPENLGLLGLCFL